MYPAKVNKGIVGNVGETTIRYVSAGIADRGIQLRQKKRTANPPSPMKIGAPLYNENKIAINVIRLTPVRQLAEVHQQIYKYIQTTNQNRPTDTSLVILYFDIWFDGPTYAYDLGYNLDVTQPVIDVLKSFASAADLGYVLTRPFQWGNPVVEWY